MKKTILTLIPFMMTAVFALIYNLQGSWVANDGTLVEAFYCIPLGFLSFAIGILAVAVQCILFIVNRNKTARIAE